MAHVDALSRNTVHISIEILRVDIIEGDWILAVQLQDEQLSHIRTVLLEGNRKHESKHYFNEYTLKDGKVYR